MAEMTDGDRAPDFDLPTDSGGRARLKDFRGRKLVVYFYPADDTSGCTLEAIDFTKAAKDFAKAETSVVGISPDSADSHDRFKAKHDLAVALAADPEKSAINAYGVWVEKNMYGRKYMGVERATFLIGRDGRVARAWRKVKVKGHVEEVLAAAQAL
jgi:thioredoxin-dependent peroxiredoxin